MIFTIFPIMADNKGILFLLGAGASIDSGLPCYRGSTGIYPENVEKILDPDVPLDQVWRFLDPLYALIKENKPGETYDIIKALGKKHPDSLIVTQNIDGYAKTTEINTIELHGTASTMTCKGCKNKYPSNPLDFVCPSCASACRPDILLFREKVRDKDMNDIYTYIKHKPAMMMVVGTSLQFLYLEDFIAKAKRRNIPIVHINPDPIYEITLEGKGKNERFLTMKSAEGLRPYLK
jgi:NAD-dependent deacetylase